MQKKSSIFLVVTLLALSLSYVTVQAYQYYVPPVQLISPIGGEQLVSGQPYNIQWGGSDSNGTVGLYYWNGTNGTWNLIADNIAIMDSTYTWNVPSGLQSNRLRIKIVKDSSASEYALSNTFFAVSSSGYLNIGKKLRYAGRAGWVPDGNNPIFLTIMPNPVNTSAMISFTVPENEDAQNITECIVMDMMAKTVAVLEKKQISLGKHSVSFVGSTLPSGAYVVAIHMQNHMQSKLIQIIK